MLVYMLSVRTCPCVWIADKCACVCDVCDVCVCACVCVYVCDVCDVCVCACMCMCVYVGVFVCDVYGLGSFLDHRKEISSQIESSERVFCA